MNIRWCNMYTFDLYYIMLSSHLVGKEARLQTMGDVQRELINLNNMTVQKFLVVTLNVV